MAGWAGFTDEDLKQIKQTTSPGLPSRQSATAATKQAMARKQKILQQRELARQRAHDFAANETNSPLPSSQRLSQTDSGKSAQKDSEREKDTTAKEKSPSLPDNDNPPEQSNDKTTENNDENHPGIREIDEKEGMSMELNRMEQFRIQQQKMEEENKQRRRKLADAIKQRSKLAKEEAEKLTKVQKELNHLDSLVTADVSVIRDKIETASIDFLQAQKRYERAEKEFVEAKIALAEKSDLKESLTEHLYTVIQQNEIRKAERLAVLMKEIGLEAGDCPATLTMPPLMCFSPINTLHRPHFPSTPPASPVLSEAAAVPEPASAEPFEEHRVKDSGESSEQADKKYKNQEGLPHIDAVVPGCDIQGKVGIDINASITEGEQGMQSNKSPGSKNELTEKAVEGEKQKMGDQTENGNAESQDGGAETAVVS